MPPQQGLLVEPDASTTSSTPSCCVPLLDPLDASALPLRPPPLRLRTSVLRRESFIVQFSKTKGPPQIAFIMILIAMGFGSTIGVVPAVMSDRFARLQHGYADSAPFCASYHHVEDEKPAACLAGSSDAQSAAAVSNLISNGLTFLMSSLLGSLSDQHGRKGILIAGLALGCMSPLMLVLIQRIPTMSPWWYYGFHASTGLVNWLAIALSALSDVLPPKFRAPGIGLLLAGFMLGFSLSPIFALLLAPFWLSLVSLSIVLLGLVSTILFVPETLPPSIAQFTKEQRRLETVREQEFLSLSLEQHNLLVASSSSSSSAAAATEGWPVMSVHEWRWQCRRWYLVYGRPIVRFVSRPIREMAILNRSTFFRLISTLAFFSGMVSAGDQVLLVYYLQERLAFTTKDVSLLFFIMGTLGLFVQGVLLKPFNDCFGEKWVVALAFAVGAIDNTMYGVARNKITIYVAVALSTLTGMAFPTISAIKANNVAVNEQGRIQGALYSLQALASGLGPVFMRFVYSQCQDDSRLGPGTMFVFAACLYVVAVGVACALPSDQANARQEEDDGGGRGTAFDYGNENTAIFEEQEDAGMIDFDEWVSSSSSSEGNDGSGRPDGNGDSGMYGSLI